MFPANATWWSGYAGVAVYEALIGRDEKGQTARGRPFLVARLVVICETRSSRGRSRDRARPTSSRCSLRRDQRLPARHQRHQVAPDGPWPTQTDTGGAANTCGDSVVPSLGREDVRGAVLRTSRSGRTTSWSPQWDRRNGPAITLEKFGGMRPPGTYAGDPDGSADKNCRLHRAGLRHHGGRRRLPIRRWLHDNRGA